MMIRLAARMALLAAAVAAPLGGQTVLTCLVPAQSKDACSVKPKTQVPRERIVLWLTTDGNPVPGRRITFEAVARGGTIAPATTDANGLAVTTFFDSAPLATDAVYMAHVDGDTTTRKITIKAWEAPTPVTATLADISVHPQWWFVDRQLPDWVTARLNVPGPTDSAKAACPNHLVKFRVPGDGSITPDTARAEWIGTECVARARWKLGKDVGINVLRGELLGEDAKPKTATVNARALPRLVTGLYGGFETVPRSYVRGAQTSTQTISVTRGDTTIESQVSTQSFSIDSTPPVGGGVFLGADFPVVMRWPALRASLGMNLLNPRNEIVGGLSLLQLVRVGSKNWVGNYSRESVGWDLHLVSIFRRRTVIANLTECLQDKNPSDCEKEKKTRFEYRGLGLMLAFDSSSLLDKLVSAFPLF